MEMERIGFDPKKLDFWLQNVPGKLVGDNRIQGTALLSQCIPTIANSKKANLRITQFITPFSPRKPSLDLFIIAGWAHQLSKSSATHIEQLLKVPKTAKILLCAPPGSYIDNRNINPFNKDMSMKNALIESHYQNVYCFQPGVYVDGGLIISPSTNLAAVQQAQTRQAWLAHLQKEGLLQQLQPQLKEVSRKAKDKLIVIYCSKDRPETQGRVFLEQIVKVKKCPVLLIGTKEESRNSTNYESWAVLCREKGLTAHSLPRTEKTEILMRALQDAEYSMATGSFSILEAKKLGIHSCAYLAPSHLTNFAYLLEEANAAELARAFQQGNAALAELSLVPNKNFSPNILSVHNARASAELEIPGLTITTQATVLRRHEIHKFMQERMPGEYAYRTKAFLAYSNYQMQIGNYKEEYEKYISFFAKYKEAYQQAEIELFGSGESDQLDAGAADPIGQS